MKCDTWPMISTKTEILIRDAPQSNFNEDENKYAMNIHELTFVVRSTIFISFGEMVRTTFCSFISPFDFFICGNNHCIGEGELFACDKVLNVYEFLLP